MGRGFERLRERLSARVDCPRPIRLLALAIPVLLLGNTLLPPQPVPATAPPAEAAESSVLLASAPIAQSVAAPDRSTLASVDAAPLLQATAVPARVIAAGPTAVPSTAAASMLPVWGQNNEPATLWSGADPDADAFTTVPAGAYFRILSANTERYHVYYGGDRARRRPGEAWVDKSSVAAAEWPKFVRVGEASPLRAEAGPSARTVSQVARGSYVEVLRQRADWAWVLYLGDGRDGGPQTGWLPSTALVPTDVSSDRLGRMLATADLLRQQPDVWLRVPYVSQLDGTPWSLANCGPTSVLMMLGAHGLTAQPSDLRRQVMAFQNTSGCDECGSYIESLAGAADANGLRPLSLRAADGKLRRWTTDEIRDALRASHPVLPQVKFRLLPGREDSTYNGDHYVLLTGVVGDYFLYNDPIDDGPGYGRAISAEQLRRAMGASDFPYAAFASTLP